MAPTSVYTFNPFSHAYQGVFNLVSAELVAKNVAKLANMNDLSDKLNKSLPANANTADLPRVLMAQTLFRFDAYGAASDNRSVVFTQGYGIVCQTENLNVIPINDIKLATFVALVSAGNKLGLTKPGGGDYVDKWRITDGRDHRINPVNGSIELVVTIEVDMRLPRSFIQGIKA